MASARTVFSSEPHARVVGGARREADRAQLEAAARTPQEQVDHHGGEDGEKEAVVRPTQCRADRGNAGGEIYRLRAGNGSLLTQRVVCQVVREVDAHVVQHDGGDHLVRPEVCLEHAGYGAPQKTRDQ